MRKVGDKIKANVMIRPLSGKKGILSGVINLVDKDDSGKYFYGGLFDKNNIKVQRYFKESDIV